MVSRFTPAARNPLSLSRSTVPGLASSVISTGASKRNLDRSSARIASTSPGSSVEGVPPPMWIVSKTSPPAAVAAISARSADRKAGFRPRSVIE